MRSIGFPPSRTVDTTEGKPGPWGQLRYTQLAIELPEEFVYVAPHDQPPIQWLFKGYDEPRVRAVLKAAALTPA